MGALPFATFGGDCGIGGIGTWAELSSIPVGACACGAEGRMASIGPLALGAKGCVRFAQGAAAVVGAFRCALLWKTFTTALRAMEIPPLVANATTFPPQAGAQQPVLTVEPFMKRVFRGVLFFPLNRGGKGTRFVRKRSDLRIV